jgi:hypothetical protein
VGNWVLRGVAVAGKKIFDFLLSVQRHELASGAGLKGIQGVAWQR